MIIPKVGNPEVPFTELFHHHGQITRLLKFSDNQVVSASEDASAAIIKLDGSSWQKISQLKPFSQKREGDAVANITKLSEECLITGTANGYIHFWNPSTGARKGCTHADPSLFHSMTVLDESILAIGRGSKSNYNHNQICIRLWKINENLKNTALVAFKGHTHTVSSLANIGGNIFASSSFDKTIIIWNKEKSETIRTLSGHTKDVVRVVFVGNNTLLSGSHDCKALLWDIEQGIEVRRLKHLGRVTHCYAVNDVAPFDEHSVLTAGSDGYVKIWDLRQETAALVYDFGKSPVRAVCALSNSVVVTGISSKVVLWEPRKPTPT